MWEMRARHRAPGSIKSMSSTMRASGLTAAAAALAAALAGCGPEQAGHAGGDLSAAEVALTVVPPGVQCLKVTVTIGSQTVTPPLTTVMSGASSASMSIGQLPAGAATFNGAAFTVACASVTASTTPAWIADPAMATLGPGLVTMVQLVFRKNNPVTLGATFLDNVAEISLGVSATYARMSDGTVREWGFPGDRPNGGIVLVPTTVPGLANVAQIAGGDGFACARTTTGGVSCWGLSGEGGSLGPGIGVFQQSATPLAVPLPAAAVDIATGQSHACAVLNDGRIFCWGLNTDGQLGNGPLGAGAIPVSSSTPRATISSTAGSILPPFARVYAGFTHTCAIDSGDVVYCWGSNLLGQLGDGTQTRRLVPTPIVGLNGTVDLGLGLFHSCALRADGQVRCWGSNFNGQLGDGTTTLRNAPVFVVGLTDALQLQVGYTHACARRPGGVVSCWGSGPQLGDGVNDDRAVPAPVVGLGVVNAIRAHMSGHTCAELGDRSVKCWGGNGSGEIGDGTLQFAAKPTTVLTP